MRTIKFVLLLLLFPLIAQSAQIETDYLKIGIDSKGYVISLVSKVDGKEYVPAGVKSPLMQLFDGKNYISPESMTLSGNQIKLSFSNKSVATIRLDNKKQYVKLMLVALTNRNNISSIVWGPYSTSIVKYIGETICVVRDDKYAIGMQALNLNTMDGLPDLLPNTSGGFFIDPLPGQSIPDNLKNLIGTKTNAIEVNKTGDLPEYIRLWRGTAAFKNKSGSELRLYSKDWRKGGVSDMEGQQGYVEPIDVDFMNSSIAFFGCPEAKTLDLIGTIEQKEGLPHPMIEGSWVKKWAKQNRAYMLYEGNDANQAFNYADSCNFELIHMGDLFKSWGHFDLKTQRYPNGASDIKALNEKARERGKRLGVHTLTVFTTANDPYISPVPSDSLSKIGSSKLVKDISNTDVTIEIEDPTFFKNPDLTHTVKIGKELVYYRKVSDDEPYRLLDCKRGQYNTVISSHKQGERIDKLQNNCYQGFYPDIRLAQVYAKRLSDVINETNLGLMDFDGFNGDWQTGHGPYGAAKFMRNWYDNLKQYPVTCGSSVSHYFWHIYTFMNWGEPWYDNLRNSQVNYRLENQRFFQRNLMPNMLGWFVLEPTYRPEDIEWIQARSAGFNAGYLLRVNEKIEQSGFKSQLFSAIREWQKARNTGAFNQEQLSRLQNPKNEFHLVRVADNEWSLYDVSLGTPMTHKFRAVQTGEPLQSQFKYENRYEEQPAQFYGTIKTGEDNSATVKNIGIEINGFALSLDATFKGGEKFYCDGKTIYICNEFWMPVQTIAVKQVPVCSKGENEIVITGEFSGKKSPAIELVCKSLGNKQTVRK